MLLALAVGGASASAAKVVVGTVGSSGSGAGQFISPTGVAVNRDGTGGASPGDVYLVDNGNRRIDQFDATGSFVRAFGWGVKLGDLAPYVFDSCTTVTGCQQGQAGGGAGALNRTGGIAIDQTTGSLYVADQNNRRIDVFSAAGDFQGAFGYGVVSGAAAPYELDFCTVITGCQAGQSGTAAGQFGNNIADVAVDPTSGDVYVADTGNNRIAQFNPTISAGAVTGVSFVRAFGAGVRTGADQLESCTSATGCQAGRSGSGDGEIWTNSLRSIALDSTGAIYAVEAPSHCSATSPCRVQRFAPDASSASDFAPDQLTITKSVSPDLVAALQVAIDPSDDQVFVVQAQGGATNNVYGIKEFNSTSSLLSTSPPGPGISAGSARGLAVGGGSDLYFATNSAVTKLGPAPAPTASILSVSGATATTATFNGTVTPPAGGYDTTYHFEYSTNGISWQRWPAGEVNVGSTHTPVTISQQVSGLEPNATYAVRLVATTGTPATTATTTFTTAEAPPSVSGTTATGVTTATGTLTGYINPNNRSTTYHVEWGKSTAYGHRVPDFESFVGSGGAPVRVSANISGLEPSTTYHFRIVASSLSGTTDGPDQSFTTLNAAGLPDGRAYELVSPADKGAVGYVNDYLGTEIRFQVAPDGQRAVYPITYGLPDATAGGPVRYVASRGASGWLSTQLTPPALAPPVQQGTKNGTGQYLYFSADLSCGVVASSEPLAPDAPKAVLAQGGFNLYRRNADSTFTTLSNVEPSNPTVDVGTGGVPYGVDGASADCSHVVFDTSIYRYPGIGASGLYEWTDGTLRNVGVLPDGTVAADAVAGFRDSSGAIGSAWNAISQDGRRIFFSATSNEGADFGKTALFLREDGTKTVDISQSQTATPTQGAFYQLASTSGDHVLFLANYGLTTTTSTGPATADCSKYRPPDPCDLYDYDVASGTLTNLSDDPNPADSNGATVAGVLGASDDASYVYFAAQGELVAGRGNTYAQNAAGATYNVYLTHDGKLSFVGLVRQNDLDGDPSGALITRSITNGASWRSQVTADGRRLLFSSSANVTGYDSGGVAEAYLYSADAGATLCVSCRPDGRPSVGDVSTAAVPTSPIAAGGGLIHGNPFHRPRALSSDGSRVFFNMPDVLAAGAVSGKSNVYEWHDGQIYLLATGEPGIAGTNVGAWRGLIFHGASASGDDVFITTSQQLVPADTDDKLDVYNIRVGGGFPTPPAPPAPCDPLVDSACSGPLVTPPAFPPAGSAAFTGVGNVTAPPKPQSKPKRERLKVTKPKTVHGTSTRIKVKVPEKGKIRTSGSGLKRSSRTAKRAGGTYRVAVRLSKRARRTLRHKGRVRVRVTVRFAPKHGKKQRERVHVTFKSERSKRHGSERTRRAVAVSRGTTVSVDAHGKVR